MMSARGILHNPGLFAGYQNTPLSAVQNWLNINHTNYLWFHHHLVFMCENLLTKTARNTFNQLRKASDVVSFLEDQLHIPNVLPSNRILGKKPGGTSGAYYENVGIKESVSSQPEDIVDSIINLFDWIDTYFINIIRQLLNYTKYIFWIPIYELHCMHIFKNKMYKIFYCVVYF